MVAYDYPPVNSAGMYRLVSMTKYLQALRWDITVVTVRDSFIAMSDGVLSLIPQETRVIRTKTVEYFRFKRRVVELLRRGQKSDPAESGLVNGGVSRPVRPRRAGALFQLFDDLMCFPDTRAGWFFPLLTAVWKLLRKEKFDVVLSSSPPHSAHLPFLFLKKILAFKWVVDFRDPWTAPNRMTSRKLSRWIHRSMESMVLSSADIVIANTPGNRLAILDNFSNISADKVHVVTNGFDEDHYTPAANGGAGADADLVYTGYLYYPMLPLFLNTLKHIRDSLGEVRVPRTIVFGPRPSDRVLREIASSGFEDKIVYRDRVSYAESVRVMRQARCLLLLLPVGDEFKTWVPSKLYAYLFSTRPVLAIVPDGDAARIVEDTGVGIAIRSADPSVVAEQTVGFLDDLKAGRIAPEPNTDELQKYSWPALADRLQGILVHEIES